MLPTNPNEHNRAKAIVKPSSVLQKAAGDEDNYRQLNTIDGRRER